MPTEKPGMTSPGKLWQGVNRDRAHDHSRPDPAGLRARDPARLPHLLAFL